MTFLRGRHALTLLAGPVVCLLMGLLAWTQVFSLAPGDVWDRPVCAVEVVVLLDTAVLLWGGSASLAWMERVAPRPLRFCYACTAVWTCLCAIGLPLLMCLVLRTLPPDALPRSENVLVDGIPTRFQLPWGVFERYSVVCLLCTGIALMATGFVSRSFGPLLGLLSYVVIVVVQSNTLLTFLPGGYPGEAAAMTGEAALTISPAAIVCAVTVAILGIAEYTWRLGGVKALSS